MFLHPAIIFLFQFFAPKFEDFNCILGILEVAMDTQRFHRWALYGLFCYAFSLKTYASCYFPNGTDVNVVLQTEDYRACDPGDEDSMCCALNRPDPDKCRSDGLCQSAWDTNVWRESCTDRSWKSSKCIKLCNTGIGRANVPTVKSPNSANEV